MKSDDLVVPNISEIKTISLSSSPGGTEIIVLIIIQFDDYYCCTFHSRMPVSAVR